MKVIECKGMDKKELVNLSESENLKELSGLDSFIIYGTAIYETTDPLTGQIQGGVGLKTDIGLFSGVSRAVYNTVECMTGLYTLKEIKEGVSAKIKEIETDGGKSRLVMELV